MREKRKFGKRAITLLLAIIMVVSIVPEAILVVESIEDQPVGIDVADMKVGKLYSAIFKTKEQSGFPDIYLFNDQMYEYKSTVLKDTLPQDLTVKKMEETDVVVYVTNEVWSSTEFGDLNDYRYIEAHEIIILECLEPDDPEPDNPDGFIEGQVDLVMDGKVVENFTLKRGEKTYVFTDLSDQIEGTPSYQWQTLVDKEDNRWATILYYDAPYAALSESLLANSRDEKTGMMTIRCIVTSGENKYVSGTLNVSLSTEKTTEVSGTIPPKASSQNAARSLSAGNMAREGDGEIAEEAFQIEVSYIYWNNSPLDEVVRNTHGQSAADTFTVTLLPSVAYDGTKEHPVKPGYKPYIRDDSATENYIEYTALEDPNDPNSTQTHKYVEAEPIVFENEKVGRKVLVYYLPTEVNFRVNHYIQNLENDEYRLIHTDIKLGYSDYPVGENHEYTTASQYADIAGFTDLFYDPNTRISANGNTEIDIYYDRNYYLVDFDLTLPDGEKGYGVMPLYVRYGTSLMLPTPTGTGYSFNGWTLVKVYNRFETVASDGSIVINKQEITDNTIKSNYTNGNAMLTIKHNLDYKSNWNVASSYYTIAYWIESPESKDSTNTSNYGIWYTVNVNANTGTNTTTAASVYSETNFKNQLNSMNTIATDTTGKNAEITAAKNDVTNMYPYIKYESGISTTTAQVVAGDGSTMVNVYFSRNRYTLKFYYAIESGGKYYIIGGSSYDFGNKSRTPIEGMRLYAPGGDKYSSATGQIEAMPVLNAKGKARESSYTMSYDPDGNHKYYYIAFTAKYGADLTELWPCDIFEPATRTSKNTHGNWSGTQAFMSAWNGEYNVKYTQDKLNGNGNLTIKGNYTQLDSNLLWKNMSSNSSTTVCYACFWENGANVSWSVPKLFRYKIWLPVLDGVTYPATKTFNGFEYIATYDENGDGKIDYYLADCYDTCDDSEHDGQTQPGLTGFSSNGYKYTANLYSKNYNSLSSDDRKMLSQAEYDAICASNSNYRNLYKDAYMMNFFYTRSKHNLVYDSYDMESIYFGESLNIDKYKKDDGPAYPSTFEPDEYTFEGWYVDKACTTRFDFNTTMPDKNIKVYAKWNPTYWDVTVYQEEPKGDGSDNVLKNFEDVPFGKLLTAYGGEPTRTAPVDGYIFAGWYYMDGDAEKRFDFNTMAIKQDYIIYAKWTSEVPVPYTIRYVATVNGQEVEIADPTTGVSLAGISKSFTAKVDKDLYSGYQTGYFPVYREQTFKMEPSQNVITFEYVTNVTVKYRIRHVFNDPGLAQYTNDNSTTLELVWDVDVNNTDSALLIVQFRGLINSDEVGSKLKNMGYNDKKVRTNIWNLIASLSPDAYSKRLIIEANKDANNEVVFNWEGRSDRVVYEVHHLYESLTDSGKYDEKSVETFEVVYPGTAIYQQVPIKGYVFEKYETNNGKNNSLQLIKPSATQEGLIISVYYKRETYNYTIKYYDDDLNTPIPNVTESKVTGKYGTKVAISDVAKEIVGYKLSNGGTVVELKYDDQEIVCEYTRLSVKYEYIIDGVGGSFNNFQETVLYGDTPKAITLYLIDGYIVDGWSYSIDGSAFETVTSEQATIGADNKTLQPVTPTAEYIGKTMYFKVKIIPNRFTIKNEGSISPDQGFIYVIKNNSTGLSVKVAVFGNTEATIYGMPLGSYTITLEDEWSWRYDSATAVYDNNNTLPGNGLSWDLSFDGDETMTVTYSNPNENYVSDNSHNNNSTKNNSNN